MSLPFLVKLHGVGGWMITHTEKHYAAFISYAHADEVMAARLHKALETFPVPKALRAKGKTTKPVFRDVAELTAAHSLSEKIRDAVQGSRVLIVLCSPAAKASHWVNEEIWLFRELHGDAAILSAIIDGTPETAFPKALTEGGREPLAAALGSDKAGFKLGVTQLAAGMLGTGLDDLIQRGAKRRARLMGVGMAASLLFSGVMGFTTLQAVEARNEAQTARGDAEGLVEYMIKDLKFKLEPVGRLDLLEGIGDKAVEYYDKQDIKNLNDDSLNRQAAARQVLAQVHLDAGRMEDAQAEIEAAADLTREVLARNPDDTDAIFAHAQSEYWVGAYYRRQGKLAEMEKPWREYDRLGQILYETDPTNFDWVMEAAWGKNNLGLWARDYNSKEMDPVALQSYSQAIEFFDKAILLNPKSKSVKIERANTISGKATMLLATDTAETAKLYQLEYLETLRALIREYPQDYDLKRSFHISRMDYYNGYVLYKSPEDVHQINLILDDLFKVVQRDFKNIINLQTFVNSVLNFTDVFDKESLEIRREQVDFISKKLNPENASFLNYIANMKSVMDIKILNANNKKIEARKELDRLNKEYSESNNNQYRWRLLYSLYLQNSEMNNVLYRDKYAEDFLRAIAKAGTSEYPTIIDRKINANIALKKCDEVKALTQKLVERGYDVVWERGVESC